MRRFLLGVAALAILGLTAYVLPFGLNRRSDEEVLEARLVKRADRLWKLRIQGDWPTIYRKMMEPEIKRKESVGAFVAKRGILRFLSYSIEKVKVMGSYAEVTCAIEVKINHPVARDMKDPFLESTVTERWLLVDGEWYKECPRPERTGPAIGDRGPEDCRGPVRERAPADDRRE